MWDVRRCEVVKVLEGHKGAVFAVEMDDATERVFSGSRDNVSIPIINPSDLQTTYLNETRSGLGV